MRSTRTSKLNATRRAALTGETYQQAFDGLRAGGPLIPDAEDAPQRQLEGKFIASMFRADIDGLSQRFAHIVVRPEPRTLLVNVMEPAASWLLFAVLPIDGGEGHDVYGVPGLRARPAGHRTWRLTTEYIPGASIHVHGPERLPTASPPDFTDEIEPRHLLWTQDRITEREADFAEGYPSVLFEEPATSTLLSRLLRRPKFWTIPQPAAHIDAWYRGRREVHLEWNDATSHREMVAPLTESGIGIHDREASDDYRAIIRVTVPNAQPAELHLRRNFTDPDDGAGALTRRDPLVAGAARQQCPGELR